MSRLNIVIVGGSFSGLQITHYILKQILPKLPAPENYHVYLINPSDSYYHTISAPRAILSDKLIDPSHSFINIPQLFAQYPSSTFTFVEAFATGIDTEARTINYKDAKQVETTISYHALVLATGARHASPLFGPSPTTDVTRQAREELRALLPTAKTVIIGGGGPVAVETGGEIGEYLNGTAGFCASRPSNLKASITVVSGQPKLLPVLREDVAKQAEVLLNRVGVDVLYSTRVESVKPNEKNGSIVTLSNGDVINADIYIPALGSKPNTSFLPGSLVNEKGYVLTNPSTLRVDLAGPRVYAIGDVSSASTGGALHVINMLPIVSVNMKRDLVAFAADKNSTADGKDREFVLETRATQFVPVGRSKGVGQLFGWRVPSIFVWALKGRDMMTGGTISKLDGSGQAKDIA